MSDTPKFKFREWLAPPALLPVFIALLVAAPAIMHWKSILTISQKCLPIISAKIFEHEAYQAFYPVTCGHRTGLFILFQKQFLQQRYQRQLDQTIGV